MSNLINSEKSNLSPSQRKLVRTPEFKAWFGDWENDVVNASRAIDTNGEPLVFLHGTKNRYNIFDTDNLKTGWSGKGLYFTTNKKLAKSYGKINLQVFLNIRKPFLVKGNSPNDFLSEMIDKFDDVDVFNTSEILTQNAYDGIFFNHWEFGDISTCFKSNQIKLADGTNYLFNLNSDDIRF